MGERTRTGKAGEEKKKGKQPRRTKGSDGTTNTFFGGIAAQKHTLNETKPKPNQTNPRHRSQSNEKETLRGGIVAPNIYEA